MAYCKKCGAYIPDGLSACLACGFDESAGAAAKKSEPPKRAQNEYLKEKLEEQRRAQQETNRRWAEQEQARRQQQKESREWAEEEFARRQAEKEQQARSYVYRSMSDSGSAVGNAGGNKLFAALSYISFLFALPYIATPNDEYAKFHARQGLRLFIFTLLADSLGALTGFGWIFQALRFYFIYKGMTNAFNGKKDPLPYIGNIGN